jgi:hypothetical protein
LRKVVPAVEFLGFSNLPVELRRQIWITSGNTPRLIFRSAHQTPQILHVCRESRVEGLKLYRTLQIPVLDFLVHSRFHTVYLNPDVDILYYGHHLPYSKQVLVAPLSAPSGRRHWVYPFRNEEVTRFAVCINDTFCIDYDWLFQNPGLNIPRAPGFWARLLTMFPRLEELVVIVHAMDPGTTLDDLVVVKRPATLSMRQQMKDLTEEWISVKITSGCDFQLTFLESVSNIEG